MTSRQKARPQETRMPGDDAWISWGLYRAKHDTRRLSPLPQAAALAEVLKFVRVAELTVDDTCLVRNTVVLIVELSVA